MSIVACAPPEEPDPPPPTTTPKLPAPHTIWVAPKETKDDKVIFHTIAAAIKAAEGRLIYVAPGTYKEQLTIPAGASITLQSDPTSPAILAIADEAIGITVEAKGQLTLSHMEIKGGERGILLKADSGLYARHVGWSGQKGHGISAEQAQLQLSHCTFDDITAASPERAKTIGDPVAISLKESTLQLHHSQFTQAGSKSILLQTNSDASVADCAFRHEAKGAISAAAAESGSVMSLHRITSKGYKEVVFFNQASGSVVDSTIEDAGGNAVFVTQQSWARLNAITIKRPARSGVSFSLSAGIVQGCQIEGAGEYGIFSTQGKEKPTLLIQGNTVTQAKGAGIQMFATRADILDNVVTKSLIGVAGDDGHGIGALDCEGLQIKNNETKDNASAGIFLNRSGGLLQGNKVLANQEIGIFATNVTAEQGLQLVENQIATNRVAGVFLLGSTATFHKNKITNTVFSAAEQSGSGVVVFGQSKAEITDDTYQSNEQHGVLIAQGSEATITQSTITGNKGYGILVQCNSGKLTETDNTYGNNTQGTKNKCP